MTFFRKLFSGIFFLLLLALPVAAQSDTGWTITNFNADILVARDTTTTVTEQIDVDFGNLQKHGIYRYIPVRYRTNTGDSLDIRFKLLSVTDEIGKRITYEQSREGENVKIKIGDPNVTISGKNTYVLTYQVQRVVTRPHDQAELYWNVTGNGWPVPIQKATARVTGSGEVLNTICFTGYYGSTERECSATQSGNSATFSTSNLLESEGLTIAVSMDPSQFTFPSRRQEIMWFLRDNWLYGVPFITFALMFMLYWQHGRDKQFRNLFHESGDVETVPLFEYAPLALTYGPPKDLSPGDVGVIVDETVHQQDITAVMIDLARRGFFKIKELKKPGLFSKGDYVLIPTGKGEGELREYELSVMKMLFGKHRDETVRLNKLHKNAYQDLEDAKKHLYEHATGAGFFRASPHHVRLMYLVSGIVFGAVGLATIGVGALLGSTGGWIAATVGSGVIVAAFSPFMPARTAKGRKALREIVGLREWIRVGAWREQIHEKLNFFEEVLPYVITFGLTQKFIRAFADANLKLPSWYEGSGTFNAIAFSNSMDSFNRSVTTGVASTRPSGSRFGSGFSGGSSGGGGGGGGGGSW